MKDNITKKIIPVIIAIVCLNGFSLLHNVAIKWIDAQKAISEFEYSVEYFRRHPLEN